MSSHTSAKAGAQPQHSSVEVQVLAVALLARILVFGLVSLLILNGLASILAGSG